MPAASRFAISSASRRNASKTAFRREAELIANLLAAGKMYLPDVFAPLLPDYVCISAMPTSPSSGATVLTAFTSEDHVEPIATPSNHIGPSRIVSTTKRALLIRGLYY